MKKNDTAVCDWLKHRQKFTLTEFEEHIKSCDECKIVCCAAGKFCEEDDICNIDNYDIDDCDIDNCNIDDCNTDNNDTDNHDTDEHRNFRNWR